ncbi:RDD family protein [Neisseriaceae bacterium JH1-16]|nr:RDD family protein [Neisseriaceae bacterium JH1-16]
MEELEYVGFWTRTWAQLLDALLIALISYPLLYLAYGSIFSDSGTFSRGPIDLLLGWVFPVVWALVFWCKKAATPGKMAISARIVDAKTGTPITVRQALIRYLGYIVSSLPLGLGYVWAGFDARKQGWHDKLAGTVVVRPKQHGTRPVEFTG